MQSRLWCYSSLVPAHAGVILIPDYSKLNSIDRVTELLDEAWYYSNKIVIALLDQNGQFLPGVAGKAQELEAMLFIHKSNELFKEFCRFEYFEVK